MFIRERTISSNFFCSRFSHSFLIFLISTWNVVGNSEMFKKYFELYMQTYPTTSRREQKKFLSSQYQHILLILCISALFDIFRSRAWDKTHQWNSAFVLMVSKDVMSLLLFDETDTKSLPHFLWQSVNLKFLVQLSIGLWTCNDCRTTPGNESAYYPCCSSSICFDQVELIIAFLFGLARCIRWELSITLFVKITLEKNSEK